MRRLLMAVVLVLLSLGTARTVQAQTVETCPMTPTIQSLHACVQHAVDQGIIDNAGVATRLFAKLDAAQAALSRGQPEVAIHVLHACVHAVKAQAGKHIDAMHAEHMVMHAKMVIEALQNDDD